MKKLIFICSFFSLFLHPFQCQNITDHLLNMGILIMSETCPFHKRPVLKREKMVRAHMKNPEYLFTFSISSICFHMPERKRIGRSSGNHDRHSRGSSSPLRLSLSEPAFGQGLSAFDFQHHLFSGLYCGPSFYRRGFRCCHTTGAYPFLSNRHIQILFFPETLFS